MTKLQRLLALVILIISVSGANALAHATLISSTPSDGAVVSAAPAIFELRFNEPVAVTRIRLTMPDEAQRDLAFQVHDELVDVALPPELKTGSQIISYRVISADGHPVAGSLVFAVGAATRVASPESSSPPALLVAIWLVRCFVYVGVMGAVGGIFFLTWVAEEAQPRILCTLRRLAFLGAFALLFSLGLQGADLNGNGWAGLLEAGAWKAGALTSLGASALAGLFALLAAAVAMRDPATTMSRIASVLALASVGLAFTLTGHVSSASPRWLMRPAVFVHTVGVTFWAGSLYPLALIVHRKGSGSIALVQRFSTWAIVFVGMLVLAGIATSVVQLGGWGMLATRYGEIWIAKMVLVTALLGLAAVNRAFLTTGMGSGDAGSRRLVTSIALELLLVVAILGLVAGWRFTPPPRITAHLTPSSTHLHLHGKRAMTDLEIRRLDAGRYTLRASVMSMDAQPMHPMDLKVQLRNEASGIEPIQRNAVEVADGSWRVDDVALSISGVWTVRLDILVNDFEQESLEADVRINR